MKKIMLLVAAALLVACGSEQSKAERASKKYLESLSNDGKIEVVEYSNVEDYTYTYDPAYLLKGDYDLAIHEAESQLSLFQDLGDTTFLNASKAAIEEAKRIEKEMQDAKKESYPMKRIRVNFRANNALGVPVKATETVYISNDFTKASLKPNEIK